MSCATGYNRFGKHPFFKTGSKFWVIKMIGKKSFYKLFNTILRPFSVFNFSAASTQGLYDQDEDDDNRSNRNINCKKQSFLPRSYNIISFNTISSLPFAHMKVDSTKYTQNPFIHQSGLQSLSTVDCGAFDKMKSNEGFSHALQLVNDPVAMDEFSLDEVETVVSEYEFEDREDLSSMEGCTSAFSLSQEQSIVVQSMDQSNNNSTMDVSVY